MKIVRGTALTGIKREATVPGEVYEMVNSCNRDDAGRLVLRIQDGAPNSNSRTRVPSMQYRNRFVELETGAIRRPGASVRYLLIDATLNVKED